MTARQRAVFKKGTSDFGITGEALCALLAVLEISGHVFGYLGRCLDGWWVSWRSQRPAMQCSADATRRQHRFPRRRFSYRRLAMMQSFEKRVSSLTVPLKSMKNLSCPDLTKIDLSPPKSLSRAPSFGGSIGNCSDTMSVSDMGTDDFEETQYSGFAKNRNVLKTGRYQDDSDSSDCSHIEMRFPAVSDDDAGQTLSDKSSQNDSGSPKLKPKTSYQLKHRRRAPVPLSPLAHQNNQIPSIKVTCGKQRLRTLSCSLSSRILRFGHNAAKITELPPWLSIICSKLTTRSKTFWFFLMALNVTWCSEFHMPFVKIALLRVYIRDWLTHQSIFISQPGYKINYYELTGIEQQFSGYDSYSVKPPRRHKANGH
ncbi:unnamed protein product [Ixodes hexagonus]